MDVVGIIVFDQVRWIVLTMCPLQFALTNCLSPLRIGSSPTLKIFSTPLHCHTCLTPLLNHLDIYIVWCQENKKTWFEQCMVDFVTKLNILFCANFVILCQLWLVMEPFCIDLQQIEVGTQPKEETALSSHGWLWFEIQLLFLQWPIWSAVVEAHNVLKSLLKNTRY